MSGYDWKAFIAVLLLIGAVAGIGCASCCGALYNHASVSVGWK